MAVNKKAPAFWRGLQDEMGAILLNYNSSDGNMLTRVYSH